MSWRVMARAVWLTPSKYCCSLAAMISQLSEPSGLSIPAPTQGSLVEALPPA